MRKLLSIVLCLVMVFCFAVPAMAATAVELHAVDGVAVGEANKSANTTVTVAIDTINPKYRVTVTWADDMSFEYDFGTWNTKDLVYNAPDWKDDASKTVKVTNYSNAKVAITSTLSNNNADTGVTLALTGGDFELASADTPSGGVAQSRDFTVGVTGAPKNTSVETYTETLTVTVSAV